MSNNINEETKINYYENYYTWDLYPGVVFRFIDHPVEYIYGNDGEAIGSEMCTDLAIISMIGDDRKFITHLDELEIYEKEVCSCGQEDCLW